MRFSSVVTFVALSFISGADAIITSFTAPSTIAPGKPFTVTLNTEGYMESVSDVTVAFVISDGQGDPQSEGTLIDSEYLGPSKSNIHTPITFTISLEPDTPAGPATLWAAVFSLNGATASPYMHAYSVTVDVGTFTSYVTITSDNHLSLLDNVGRWRDDI